MSWQHPESVQIYRALDLGYQPDPTYCLWIAHAGKRYVAFKERVWYKKIASEVAADIIEDSLGMHVIATYADPTCDIKTQADVRTIRDIFEDAGVPLELSVNNREHFAHAVHTALAQEVEPGVPKLQIYGRGCPYLVKAIPQMQFDPKHPLRMADHKHDHPVVTLAYFLISSGAMDRYTGSTKTLPKWMRPKREDVNRQFLGWDNVREIQ